MNSSSINGSVALLFSLMVQYFLVSVVMKTVSNSICEPASVTAALCTSGMCQPHYKTVDSLASTLKDTLINVVNMTAHHKSGLYAG